MTVLDTSALIRFFTNDVPVKASKIKKILDTHQRIHIPNVVFPELEYVLLGNTYNGTRDKVHQAFQFLISQKNIKVSKEVKRATSLYAQTNLDIADCIIAVSAKEGKLISFDNDLLNVTKKLKP